MRQQSSYTRNCKIAKMSIDNKIMEMQIKVDRLGALVQIHLTAGKKMKKELCPWNKK